MEKNVITKNDLKKPLGRRVAILLAILAILILVAYFVGGWYFRNRAEELASPVEATLVKYGGVKECVNGDSGRGPDNQHPWYQSYFSFSASHGKAEEAALAAASQAGYKLSHASVTNRGSLRVDDKYISEWYFDTVQKQQPYSDIKSGIIELSMTVDAHGTDRTCGGKILPIDDGHSVVSLNVNLPEFK